MITFADLTLIFGSYNSYELYNFTECYTEADMDILSVDTLSHDGLQNIQPDPEACRASCKLLGSDARYFTWAGPDNSIGNDWLQQKWKILTKYFITFYLGTSYQNTCWCEPSNDLLVAMPGHVSGNVHCTPSKYWVYVNTLRKGNIEKFLPCNHTDNKFSWSDGTTVNATWKSETETVETWTTSEGYVIKLIDGQVTSQEHKCTQQGAQYFGYT